MNTINYFIRGLYVVYYKTTKQTQPERPGIKQDEKPIPDGKEFRSQSCPESSVLCQN